MTKEDLKLIGKTVHYTLTERNCNEFWRVNTTLLGDITPGDVMPFVIVSVLPDGNVRGRVICPGRFDGWTAIPVGFAEEGVVAGTAEAFGKLTFPPG